MVSSFLLAAMLVILAKRGVMIPAHISLLATIAVTTIVWLVTAYATPSTDRETLRRFYMKVRPAGPGWRAIRAECQGTRSPDHPGAAFACWFAGLALVYGALFGAGHLLFGHTAAGLTGTAFAIAGAAVMVIMLPRLWGAQ